jgi:hypothetical protein
MVEVVNGRLLPDRTVIVSRGAIAAVAAGGIRHPECESYVQKVDS